MKRGIILELIPQPGFDYAKVVEDLANKRPIDLTLCKVRQHMSVVDSFREEFVDYIGRYGLSALMRRERLDEAVVQPRTTLPAVLSVLHAHLSNLAVTTDLIIVDSYFLASTNDQNYVQLVHDAIQPVLMSLRRLKIVTLPDKVDTQLLNSVTILLAQSAPHINISHAVSSSFHDRLWLNPLSGKDLFLEHRSTGLERSTRY